MRVKGLFRSPHLFRRNRPKIPCTWPDNPTHAASFSRQFPARTARRPPRLGQKRGLFAPPAPASPAFCPPERPVLPRRRPFLPGARPDEAPACPGFARDPGARAHPRDPRNPRVCGFFARLRPLPPALRRPNARRLPRPPPKPPRRAPPARPLPPPAARRSPRRPAKAHPWGWATRLPWSAFPLRRGEVCAPRGRSDPWA